MMSTQMTEQKKRMHPHKFTLWLGLGSIVMMFAGMTSAYIVKRNQANWQGFDLPKVFWYSTFAILLSSVTIHLAIKAFKSREMAKYRQLIAATTVLGIAFIVLQIIGFSDLNARGIKLTGQGSNVAGSFLFVIAALHILHVLGGIVVLAVMFVKAFVGRSRNYSAVPVEMTATYWHFVDGLWIYLFLFLNWIQ
jgi:cytochrome c oxidase subunit III